MRFHNRGSAGRALAAQLREFSLDEPVVLALPRGGVPVAFEVSEALNAPLDLLGAGKLGAPRNSEYAIGAAAEDGTAVVDEQAALEVGLKPKETRAQLERLITRVAERTAHYRGGRPMIGVTARTVVLIDDGLGTGLTCLAALRALRELSPARIILAVPVAAAVSLAHIAPEADDVVCPLIPPDFVSVGRWYDDFAPVADETVIQLLERARAHQVPAS
jgi:predicted phosphoribosyltransferase